MVRTGELLAALPEADRVTPIVARGARARHALSRAVGRDARYQRRQGARRRSPGRSRPHLEKALAQGRRDRSTTTRPRNGCTSSSSGGRACYVGVSRGRQQLALAHGHRAAAHAVRPRRRARRSSSPRLCWSSSTSGSAKRRLAPGMTAVDLGASPGGWTWQLVQHGLMVTAVDNGPMDARLLDSGQVKHRRDDGFHFRPPEPVDWMVCDMVESPSRIARARGAVGSREGWCRETHLQPEAADEEALGGGRALPRAHRRGAGRRRATSCA